MARKLFAKHVVRKIFLEDWGLKLTALAITLGLWFAVTGLRSPTTRRLTVPLNLNPSSNAQITNDPLTAVELEISGDKHDLDQIKPGALMATVDLTDRSSGEQIVTLSPDTVFVSFLPQGVKVVDVAPGRIAVTLEAVDEKEMEVKIVTKGAPAAGYEVYSALAQPPSIRVRGPASVMRSLEFVQTDAIDLANARDDLTARRVAVNSPNPQTVVRDTFVDVVFRIGEKRIERAFSIDVPGEPSKTASFVLYGPRSVLSKMRSEVLIVELSRDQNGVEHPRLTLPTELENVVEVRKLKVD